MEDVQIIDLLFRRDPAALEAVEARYGKKCLASACRILDSLIGDRYIR